MKDLMPQEVIERKIYLIRGRKVMLDSELAGLYGVETKNLNLQVRRNARRFPEDFMFKLTKEENLRLQFATSSYGGRRYLPYVFTEQGVAMLSSVLNSERAIEVNIAIMRAFVRLRDILLKHKDLAVKIAALELKYDNHDMRLSGCDKHILAIFEAIKKLMVPPPEKPRRIMGFKQE